VNAVRHESGKTAPEEIRPASLKVVEGLLNRGLEVVDYYEGRGWSKWPEQSTPAVLARIEREWNALGRDPNLGDIAWFRLPE
jgi:hypothetical protein